MEREQRKWLDSIKDKLDRGEKVNEEDQQLLYQRADKAFEELYKNEQFKEEFDQLRKKWETNPEETKESDDEKIEFVNRISEITQEAFKELYKNEQFRKEFNQLKEKWLTRKK